MKLNLHRIYFGICFLMIFGFSNVFAATPDNSIKNNSPVHVISHKFNIQDDGLLHIKLTIQNLNKRDKTFSISIVFFDKTGEPTEICHPVTLSLSGESLMKYETNAIGTKSKRAAIVLR